ncbi:MULTISPECIES: ribonuclease D [unclassified Bosea (in: a-proteobacteria)]|jgi:ribonuclease D|uniref:ribonuclease D n=1 Tax=Bosea sp. (in: a-proteobacteria) TaxID=1871050 RepID=UPI000868FBE8|nr:ribonuclease D [Bosea sp. (in: a-proteobacteria)]MBN9446196.1 ribonuclease D [Bosea sp. (in: a-proteobacteria)]MBN9469949.1 ribonuclease D [Bosea sp. (in: a-proteobacteria)]ODT45384.1 MAG: ribonuclease D [Methylobacterium sp. SCN 67-24]
MNLITTTAELAEACARLAQHPFVTVDTEFLRETTYYPKLCLIQLASPDEAVLVDPLAPDLSLEPFLALMSDPKVVKVFHAARQDLEIVWMIGKLIPTPLFDTQVAAMVCGYGDSVGYEQLANDLAKARIDKSSRFTDWSRRPLTDAQLAYAESDVTHLRDIYLALAADLAESGRESWVAEEMAVLTSPGTYEVKPENAWQRLKGRIRKTKELAALIELAAWREREAQHRDVPRQRVLKDDTLMDIVQRSPRSAEALGELRSVPNGFERSRAGGEVLAAIERAQALDPQTLPKLERERGRSGNGAVLDLLKVLLKATADAERVAPKILASSDDLEAIAFDDQAAVPALQGWRREVFGEKALALKNGTLALRVVRGRVTVG